MMTRRLTLLVLMALVAACGADGSDTGADGTAGGTTTPLAAPDEARVLLEIREEGGFVPVEYSLSRIPRHVVLTDGRIISPGPVTLEYPGRALPNLRVTQVDASALDELRALAVEMGLPDIDEEHDQQAMSTIADAPDTFVDYHDDEGEHTYGVYALGIPEAATDDPRADQLEALIAEIDRLVAEGTDAGEFRPEAVEVFAAPARGGVEPEFANVAPWPLDIGYDEMAEGPVEHRCTLLEGATADDLWTAMGDANQATTFELDGTEYRLIARPLLPGQDATC